MNNLFCRTCKKTSDFDIIERKTTKNNKQWKKLQCKQCNKIKCGFIKDDDKKNDDSNE